MARRVLVTGGKGGVGKTLIAVNLAYLATSRSIPTLLVDADVSNPGTWITLGAPRPVRIASVYSFRPRILDTKCTLCGECVRSCPMHALVLIPGKRVILVDTLCEGCSLCMYVCPYGAIEEDRAEAGWISKTSRDSLPILIGELRPGERREEGVVMELLNYVKEMERDRELVVIDGPVGTGKLIHRLARYSHRYLCVVEPTPLSLSDMRKLVKILDSSKIVAVLNKVGVAPRIENEARALFRELGVPWVEIPFSTEIAQLYASSTPLLHGSIWSKLEDTFSKLLELVLER